MLRRCCQRLAVPLMRPQQGGVRWANTSVASLDEGAIQKTFRREAIGVAVMGAITVGFILHDMLYPEEEFEGVIPPYPYLRIRNTEFPWGTDMGPFEHRRVVGEKPE